MPRLTQQTPKYRKHKASGQAFVELNGHRHYLGPHSSHASRSEYDRLISEWLSLGRRPLGNDYDQGSLTVSEMMLAYWKFAKQHYVKNGSPTSEQKAIRWALKPLRHLYGKTRVAEFGPLSLKAVRSEYMRAGLCRKSINQNIGRLVRVFKWAAAEELIPASIPQALSMVSGLKRGRSEARETAPISPVKDSIVEATLQRLPEVVADMVRLQKATGMRPAEVCMMRPCDIDRSGKVWLYRPDSHKTEHHGIERVVPLGPKSQDVILRYLARDAQDCCFRPCDSESKRRSEVHANRLTPLSCGNRPGTNRRKRPKRTAGTCYDTDAYRRAIHRACDKAFPHPELSLLKWSEMTESQRKELRAWQSSQRWSPNRLRHAAATEVRREFGLEAAQVILGHRQANVTQVYAERDLAKALDVAQQIG